MRTVRVHLTLLYYDFPQIFIGEDEVENRYLCMATDDGEWGPNFACIPVSASRVMQLTHGLLDVRAAFESPEVHELYTARFTENENGDLSLAAEEHSLLPSALLPESGLLFNIVDDVARDASTLNTTVSHVSLEVPEAAESARIHTTTLATFLNIFQSALKSFGRLAARTSGRPLGRSDDSFLSDVYGFARGSFTVKFRSSYPGDLNGENATFVAAMTQLEEFFQVANNPNEAIEFLQHVRGHAASSLIRLLTFLSAHSAAIKLSWANPSMPEARAAAIRLEQIGVLIEACRRRTDLLIEEVVIRGRISKADVDNASWKIRSEDDNQVYGGEIADGSGINLSGMVMAEALYEFTCREEVDIVPATGQEVRRLFLTKIRKL